MITRRSVKLFFTIMSLFFAFKVFSYDNRVIHPELTQAATAIYNQQSSQKLTQEQINWIVKGSIDEDADPRYLNHFYDPTTGKGLDGIYDSAKQWSQNQNGFIGATGDYSEKAILENYKQSDLSRAYQGIGHILHLIQDMAVPAHTRNDAHANGDPYEKWSQQYGKVNLNKVPQYNASSDLTKVFDDISTYSNNNFFSKDSIINPNFVKKETIKVNEEDITYGYCRDNLNNEFVCLREIKTPTNNYYEIDENRIGINYWNLLHPKAVGYSAGTIDYFIKKFEEIDKNKQQQKLSIWQKTKNLFSSYIDAKKYEFADSWSVTTGNIWEGLENGQTLAKNIAANLGFFKEATEETTQKVAEKTVEKTVEVTNKVIETEKLIINKTKETVKKTVSQSKEASDKGKVLGEKIFNDIKKPINKIAKLVEPAEAAIKNQPKEKIKTYKEKEKSELNSRKNSFVFVLQNPEDYYNNENNETASTTEKQEAKPSPDFSIAIKSGPSYFTNQNSAFFQLMSDTTNLAYQCKLDDNDWQVCSASTSIINLTEGSHEFLAKAMNEAGGMSSSTAYSWLTDYTAPTSSITIEPEYLETGFVVNWFGQDQIASSAQSSSLLNFDLMQKVYSGEWQDWQVATTATSSLFITPVEPEQEISFKIRARDKADNLSDWSGEFKTKVVGRKVEDILISEIQISGITAKDEFVEFYNPTDRIIGLAEYKLKKKNSNGEESLLIADFGDHKIYPHGYFLVTHPEYKGNVKPDIFYPVSYSMAEDNTILLYKNSMIIDKVGFGEAKDFEGSPSENPKKFESLERKAFSTSTSILLSPGGLHVFFGNSFDSNNNLYDFILKGDDPQNIISDREPKVVAGNICSYLILDETGGVANQSLSPVGSPYCVNDFLEIKAGNSLTIEAGTTIKFSKNAGFLVAGELRSLGQPGLPIVFTSIFDMGDDSDLNRRHPDRGDWRGIEVIGGKISIDYSKMFFGGQYWLWTSTKNKKIENKINLAMMISPIENIGVIKITSGQAEIKHSLINNNVIGIEFFGNNGSLFIDQSKIFSNSLAGLINYGTSTVEAMNNWWGDETGPYNSEENPGGYGNEVRGQVIFSPWLTDMYNYSQ